MPPKTTKKSKPGVTVTVDALIEQGNIALARCEPELALSFFTRAYEIRNDDTNIMDALSDVYLQLGNQAAALELLLKSTEIAPEVNPHKWLYLAQLQDGNSALVCYEKAVSLLSPGLHIETTEDVRTVMVKQLSKIYSSIAELYLTDLCYDKDAEVKCESAVSKSLELDPTSLDGMQALASLRLSQCRADDAGQIMATVGTRILTAVRTVGSRTLTDEIAEDDSFPDFPGSEATVACAKLMLDCVSAGASSTLASAALDLLSDLLVVDDSSVDTWFVAGMAALLCTPKEVVTATSHLQTAKDMLDTEREREREQGDEGVIKASEELYRRILEALQECECESQNGQNGGNQSHKRMSNRDMERAEGQGMDVEIVVEGGVDDEEEWSDNEDKPTEMGQETDRRC